MRQIDHQADIISQLQDACDLATDPRELERLCGNARWEIINVRQQRDSLLAALKKIVTDGLEGNAGFTAMQAIATVDKS